MTGDRAEAGFTLIELLISLALFALIALAGVALVDSILRIQAQTGQRLERLGDIQRAMFVVDNDLGQMRGGPVVGAPDGVSFNRRLAGKDGEPQPVAYALVGDTLVATVASIGQQRLLSGVATARWQYLVKGQGWLDRWPPDPQYPGQWPAAIALDIVLKPAPGKVAGTLRRVIPLPAQP